MRTIPLSLSLFTLLFISCETVVEHLDVDYKYDYFPLEIGKYITYEVDSIVYDPIANGTFIDTISYEMKLEIVDTFLDNANRKNYVFSRFIRSQANENWEISATYHGLITDNRLEWVEDNRRFVKIVFPPKVGETWDGNRYFGENDVIDVAGETLQMFKNWSYAILGVTEETLNGNTFTEVLTIQQADDENLLERRYSIEKYAAGVGLAYKKMMILDTQCGGNLANCQGMTWEQKAETGFILTMTVKDYN